MKDWDPEPRIKEWAGGLAKGKEMKDWDPEPRIKEWVGGLAKGKEMKFAEAFRVITLESDEDWEKRKGHIFTPDDSN